MNVIRLDTLATLPDYALVVASRHQSTLRRASHVDELLQVPALLELAKTLNAICSKQGVIAYHFTRAERDSIRACGLTIKTGAERRATFLEHYACRFSTDELASIRAAWSSYFSPMQSAGRDGRIFVALTHKALQDGGARDLLRYFGGEAVYMPLTCIPRVAEELTAIGEPLVVECRLDPGSTRTYSDIPWGTAWLSTLHRTFNPDAIQFDQDVAVLAPISARDVLDIRRVDVPA